MGISKRLVVLVCVFLLTSMLFVMVTPRKTQAAPGDLVRCCYSVGDEYDPSISADGNVVALTTNRAGNTDVMCQNIETGELVTVADGPYNQELSAISGNGNYVAYTDLTTADVIRYDLSDGSSINLTNAANAYSYNPDISGDGSCIVWEDRRDGNIETYWHNCATGEEVRVTNDPAMDQRPSISGDGMHVTWESAVAGTAAKCSIYAKDMATGDLTLCYAGEYTEHVRQVIARRPDISADGRFVAFEVQNHEYLPDGSWTSSYEILRKDLQTGELIPCDTDSSGTRLPGIWCYAKMSGDGRYISFWGQDPETGIDRVYVKDLASGALVLCPGVSPTGNQYLSDISADGKYVTFTDDSAGQLDVYRCEVPYPRQIEVSPQSLDYGDVQRWQARAQMVTISNTGNAPLTVSGISLASSSSPYFSITMAPTTPTLAPGATSDVEVTFKPTTTGSYTGSLEIRSDDQFNGLVTVPLAGRGVFIETPSQQVTSILTFFDSAVSSGNLAGVGSGNSAEHRLNALKNMIEAAGDLITRGRFAQAIAQLQAALQKVDGQPNPPDFADGAARQELADRIQALMSTLSP